MVIFPLAPDQTIAQMWSNGAQPWLATCSTPELWQHKKLDQRRRKDKLAQQQQCWWLLIAVIIACQELKLAAVRWRGTVVSDHGDSDTQVELTCTQCTAPSSTNAVVEEVATHGGVPKKNSGHLGHRCLRQVVGCLGRL